MLVAFSVAPAGGSSSDSVHDAVAAAVAVVRDSGLPNRTDSMFTTIEGDWDECMAVVRGAVEAVGAFGTRTSLVLKADIRPGHTGELTGKINRLEAAIARTTNPAEFDAPIGEADAQGDGVPEAVRAAVEHPTPEPVAEAPGESTAENVEAAAENGAEPIVSAPTPNAGVLTRFVAATGKLTLQGIDEDQLSISCAPGARVLVASSAPPEQLRLIKRSRALLRTDGTLRLLDGDLEVWTGATADTVPALVWADGITEPDGVWIEVPR